MLQSEDIWQDHNRTAEQLSRHLRLLSDLHLLVNAQVLLEPDILSVGNNINVKEQSISRTSHWAQVELRIKDWQNWITK